MQSAMDIFSKNLVAFRRKRGWTQDTLAELADISLASLRAYEGGRRWPGREAVRSLAGALEIAEPLLFYDPEVIGPTELIQAVAAKFGYDVPVITPRNGEEQ